MDIWTLYSQDLSSPLLDADEEEELARHIVEGRQARAELVQARDGERDRLLRLVEKGQSAREKLILANLRLVVAVAKRYTGRGLSLLDLIQEGNVGLVQAVDRFDPRRGTRLSTYATDRIKQRILSALAQSGNLTIPEWRFWQAARVRRAQAEFEAAHGRVPTAEEVAEATDLSVEELQLVEQAKVKALAVGHYVGKDGELAKELSGPEAQVEREALHTLLVESLEEVLALLPERDREVLYLRCAQELTLVDVGRRLGISRERVRQIEKRALQFLRHPQVCRKLAWFLEE